MKKRKFLFSLIFLGFPIVISFIQGSSIPKADISQEVTVADMEKFLANAALDAWHPRTNEVIFMRRDNQGIWQLYKVDEMADNPEAEAIPLSTRPLKAIGIEPTWIPRVHKGASDWHPSGEWFVTEVEIPNNISWKYTRTMPEARALAEPGAGWWNNLFLVKADGSLWIKLTDFTADDIESGVLYPKFSPDGTRLCWAEKIGGARPFDRYPFAQWILKTARIDWSLGEPQLVEIRSHPLRDGAIFEPQFWTADNKIIFAADIGYSRLPYPAYRLDIWEAEVSRNGRLQSLRNLTKTPKFYEEQASVSPDHNLIAFMANLFDVNYEWRLNEAWKKSGTEINSFIVQELSTDLYLMDRRGRVLTRLTYFVDEDWGKSHPLVTRSAWSNDGRTILVSLTLRDNVSGKKVDESIYRLQLAD
ncbi:MAG: hypothetical protein N3B16_11765 [Candidatus Aminicenantes bacterium]|nr:hypothetical protein [Candidatus Aminicenantes bacterium]